MFNKILILLIVIIGIQSINSLNSVDLCKSSVCNEEYSYKCTNNLCSFNKQTCVDYHKYKLNYISRSFHDLITFETCGSYKFGKNFYCKKNTNCFKNDVLDIGYLTIKKDRKIKTDCKCNGKYSYKCGNHCTINSNYCDLLKLRIKYQKKMNKKGVLTCPSVEQKLVIF
jgi:hypothetical protein